MQVKPAHHITEKASFFGNEVPGHSLVPAFSASYNEADTYTVGEAPAELYTV